jgi:hypothetical protein
MGRVAPLRHDRLLYFVVIFFFFLKNPDDGSGQRREPIIGISSRLFASPKRERREALRFGTPLRFSMGVHVVLIGNRGNYTG